MRLTRLACLVLVALAGPAQAGPQEPDESAREEIQRLEAWPEVPKEAKRALRTDVERLRKAHTEEMGSQAREALIALGDPAGPELLKGLGKEKDEEARERIQEVLTAITDARHTRLLAREFGHRSQAVRTFALGRCGAFPDPGIRAEAEAALAKAAAVKEPEKADRAEELAAALAATASGSLGGLDTLHHTARKSWGAHGTAIRRALEAVRGAEASKALIPRLEGERAHTIATLNLLAGAGDRSATGAIKPLLDSKDNSIRIAAINALRGIVDGDPPLDRLPVFEAIELAGKWKSRV